MVLSDIAIEFCECYSKIVYCCGIVDEECRGTARNAMKFHEGDECYLHRFRFTMNHYNDCITKDMGTNITIKIIQNNIMQGCIGDILEVYHATKFRPTKVRRGK